jgi:hypothetical protein
MSTRKVNSGIRVTPEMKIEMKELYRMRAIRMTLDKSRRWTRGTSYSQFWEGFINDHLKIEKNTSIPKEANNISIVDRLIKKIDPLEIAEMYRRGEIDIE